MTPKTIAQRYVLNDEIGSGGMGTVYKGLDSQTEQIVAIKELHSNLADDQLIERFKREGEALRELNHPNIVKMLDTIEEAGQHYLVMEFVSGGDLADLLKQGQLPVERILNVSIDLADALTRAHRLNIIHRDLKPANILIGDDGVLRLTDFGVAHVGSKARLTDTDAIIGTVDYLPPEAFTGRLFDERGDIWAFGCDAVRDVVRAASISGSIHRRGHPCYHCRPCP
jgi:serine/threonine protein kinase